MFTFNLCQESDSTIVGREGDGERREEEKECSNYRSVNEEGEIPWVKTGDQR
jgi:hypothetical protein